VCVAAAADDECPNGGEAVSAAAAADPDGTVGGENP
jgi:hypothetical protein